MAAMDRSQLPLNALRAFEVAARHLNLTRAAVELCVTQAALSHQIRKLEEKLDVTLFRRVPRGLVLTEEGEALLPVLTEALDLIAERLHRFGDERFREVLNVGVVSSFAAEWLLPRLDDFQTCHPAIDVRIYTNNNRVNIAEEGLNLAIRFGDGNWRATHSVRLLDAPFSLFCHPAVAERLKAPADLQNETLLRSYRGSEWTAWFSSYALPEPVLRGPVFDSSLAIAEMAARGMGVGLLPAVMFAGWVKDRRLCRPFPLEIDMGAYWLSSLQADAETIGSRAFRGWLLQRLAGGDAT
ncbi:LysR family transcriptional regulator [Fulvimarina sp. MAC8]|uniref:LysR family transcriptional regulator n=1 Tax=Fulvimarina sp. MAC8 TaxID=3162874 RepID=UPI0032EDB19A